MGACSAKATSKDVVVTDIALDVADTTLSDSLESRSLKVRLQALKAIAESDKALEEHHEAIARCLTDGEMDVHVMLAALNLLSKSDALVSQHHAAIAQILENGQDPSESLAWSLDPARDGKNSRLLCTALTALGRLTAALETHLLPIARLLTYSDADVRTAALAALAQSPEAVTKLQKPIMLLFESDHDGRVRKVALDALAMSPETAAQHTAMRETLESEARRCGCEDVDELLKLQAHYDAVAQRLQTEDHAGAPDGRGAVSQPRVDALRELAQAPWAVERHSAAIARLLTHRERPVLCHGGSGSFENQMPDGTTREVALNALAVSPEAVAKHREAIAAMLQDTNPDVRQAAERLLEAVDRSQG